MTMNPYHKRLQNHQPENSSYWQFLNAIRRMEQDIEKDLEEKWDF